MLQKYPRPRSGERQGSNSEADPEDDAPEKPTDEYEEMSLVGSDVVALFPSITAERSARIVRKEIERSEIVFEGFDDEKARAYINMNKEIISDYEDIAHLLPKRKAKTGTAPTMSSIGRKWNPNNQWEFPDEKVSPEQAKKLIGLVAEIAIIILFTNFSYKFGGKFYKQRSGGPIGVRATGAIAQLVMENWARSYKEILEKSGLTVSLMAGYVDDGRQITSVLQPGMRFCKEKKIFQHSPEAEKEDVMKKNQGETSNQRMARITKEAMNNINEDLVFTTESQEDFNNERLPTLDFQMWMEENKIKHTYFQKPMRTPLVIMERSAMSSQQKFSILGNELCRRMSNIQIEVIEHKEVLETVENFTKELKNSGYSFTQSREIVNSGLRGWKRKIMRRQKKNIPFYRPASSTVEERLKKDLLEKESWYKEPEDTEETSPSKIVRTNESRRLAMPSSKGKSVTKRKRKEVMNKDIKSVVFIPHTKDSILAKELRNKELEIQKITGNRMKIVEKSGNKLEDILTSTDPWKGADCGRSNCFLCNTKNLTGKNLKKDCTKRNILYEIKCLTCEEENKQEIIDTVEDEAERKTKLENIKTYKYIGESGRSAYERGYEHLDQLASLNHKSHMLKHMLHKHEQMDFSEVRWGMFILQYLRTAFERQIMEAVTIEKESKTSEILNSKAEWNQCALPRLVTRIGNSEAELKELEKEVLEEKRMDEEIEEKVRNLRKARNKARLKTEKETSIQPKKKLKMEDSTTIAIRDVWGHPPPTAPEKDKKRKDSENSSKTKRARIETLTNAHRIEDKVVEGEQITEFEIITTDWDEVLKQHKERLEKEVEDKKNQLERQEIKEKSWALYKECKDFMENNVKHWEEKKRERELERKRKERLMIGEQKREKVKEKVRQRELEKELEKKLDMLPRKEKEKIVIEEEKKRLRDLAETKKNLWKFRSKEKKPKTIPEVVKKLEKQTIEEKIQTIDKILEDIKNEKEKKLEEEKKRKEEKLKEWRKKVAIKDKKEKEKKEAIENQKKINQRLEMLKWVTTFIEEHQEEWENIRKEKEKMIEKELRDWNKAKRLEKIKKLKEKWSTTKAPAQTEVPSEKQVISPKNSNWVVWREKNIDPVPTTPTIPLRTPIITPVPSAAKTWTTSPTAGTSPRSTTGAPVSSTVPVTTSGCTSSSNTGEVTKPPMLEHTGRIGPIIKKAKLSLDKPETEKSIPINSTRSSNNRESQAHLFQPQKSIRELFQDANGDSSKKDNKHQKTLIPHNVVILRFQDENTIPAIIDRKFKFEDDQKLETTKNDESEEDIEKIKYEITLKSPVLKIIKKNEDNPVAKIPIEKEDNVETEDNLDRNKKDEKTVKLRPPKKEDNPKKETKKKKKKDDILPTQKTTMKTYFMKTTRKNKDNPEQQTHVPNSSIMKTRGPTKSSDSVKTKQLSWASDVGLEKTDVSKSTTISHNKSDLTQETTFTSCQLSEGLPSSDDQPV